MPEMVMFSLVVILAVVLLFLHFEIDRLLETLSAIRLDLQKRDRT